MTDREFYKRFDAFIGRMDAHIGRMDAHMERQTDLMERIENEHRLNRESFERMFRQMTQVVDRNAQAFRESSAAISELRGETRAQTQAILKLLDRFGNGPATA